MAKKPTLSAEDSKLFRQAMRNVKPLVTKKKILTQAEKPTAKIKIRPIDEEKPSDLSPFTDEAHLPNVRGDEIIEYSRPGIHHKTLRKLHRGQYNVEAILDLHGMTVSEAKAALISFLKACQEHNARFVLIIHGKGRHSEQPILKNKVNHWLRQTDQVLAFHSASTRGAVGVLLKKGRSI